MTLMQLIRNLIFYALLIPSTIFCFCLVFLSAPFPYRYTHKAVNLWSFIYLNLAKWICGLNYEVKGLENLPDTPCIVMSNHQSSWETVFMQLFLPAQCWIIKRELLLIPCFGWGLAIMKSIAIDRKKGKAFEQILKQGRVALNEGRWIMIYPEGTRVSIDKHVKYRRSGAALAVETGAPYVLIAHNSGAFWPRGLFIKHKGTISVSISQPMLPKEGQTAESLIVEIQDWIENERAKMPSSPHHEGTLSREKPLITP